MYKILLKISPQNFVQNARRKDVALSDTWIKANHQKEREKPLEKTDRDGLSARLSPKGKVTFQIRYLYNGEPKRVDIGSYPLLSLKEARAETQRLKARLEQGYDPKIVRLLEKQAILNADSIEIGVQLTQRQIKRAAEPDACGKRKLPFFVDPIEGKLKIEKSALIEIYTRCQIHAENNAHFGFHNWQENHAAD